MQAVARFGDAAACWSFSCSGGVIFLMATLLLGRFAWRTAALVACETMLIVLVVGSAVYSQDASGLYRLGWVQRALLISVLCQLCLYGCDSYDHKIAVNWPKTAVRIAQALGVASILLAITFLIDPRLVIERGASSSVTVIILGGLIVWRRLFAAVNGALRPRERLLIVGTGDAAGDLASDLLVRGAAIGVEVVGFLLSDDCPRDEVPAGVPVLGSLRNIANVVEKHQVTQLVISFADARGRLPMDDLLALRLGGVGVDHIATIYEKYTGRVAVENLRPSWLVFSPGFRHTRTRELLKRAFDITSAVVGLVLALPVMALVALAVRRRHRARSCTNN